MRNKLGVLLVEDHNGEFSVQLFSEPEKMQGTIDELKGRLYDKPSRVTWVKLHYDGDRVTSDVLFKDLPMEFQERHEAWLVGEGPVKLTKEGEGEKKDIE